MCGIAGIVRNRDSAPGDGDAVRRMLEAQRHRGPDGEGLWQEGRVVLGHRRLSIIDVSSAGRQPMPNEDGSVQVTFNGEIYNHRELREQLAGCGHQFRSRTDTEVLVHGYEQWGIEGLLERLRGMFAFALHDVRRGLLIARDRLGIKPLYFHQGPDFLIFASEVKALLRSGLTPTERDRHALTGYLMAGAIPAPLTMIKGIRCLAPGHWAEWKDSHLQIRQYWDLPSEVEDAARTSDGTEEGLTALLEDTVRRHLISDVPLGVFLSGGVDSASLVALASRVQKLTTLTVVFDETEFSEAGPAAEIARHYGTSHHQIRLTGADFNREVPSFLAAMDQPTNDGVNAWFVSKAAREAGLTVVLSGLGGDEVFWGYKYHRWMQSYGWALALARPAAYAGSLWGNWRGTDKWQRSAWLKSGASNDRLYLALRGFFAPGQVARLMDLTQQEIDAAVEEHFGGLGAASHQMTRAINCLEIKRYLHDQLLRDTDVFSMAHSIEVRVPYLDHVLFERLWKMAPAMKLDRELNKPLLVRAVGDSCVVNAGSRPKRGFTFPMAQWMKIAAPGLREMAASGTLEPRAVRECWADFAAGRMHWSRAWALTVLGAGS